MDGDRPLSPQEIKSAWETRKIESATAGTWTHLQCECVMNGGYIRGTCPEIELLKMFLAQTAPLLAYRAEWCVWADKERLAGTIDFVASDMRGNLVFLVCVSHVQSL